MTDHTPGPWEFIEGDGRELTEGDGPWTICGANDDLANVYNSENATVSISQFASIANARLISAAPELLAALTKIIEFIDREGPASMEWQAITAACEEGATAITKATGKPFASAV